MPQLELTIRKHFPPLNGRVDAAQPGFHLDVSLQCEAGITVLFGASGAGKTLTLDALAGFYRPAEGRIVLDDAILFDAGSGVCLPPRRRGVGYVFQNHALFPHMTVERNLAFGIQLLAPVERSRRIGEQLARFGIATKAGRLPRELSGGEKQRVSIARALIGQPRLLLMDEPVRGLDYPLRADFYGILRQVREEHQIPIVLVTHDAEEAYLLADRIAVLEQGRVVQFTAPQELFTRPASPSVARLLGIGNVYQGTIESLDPMAGTSRLRTEGFTLAMPYLPGRLRGDAAVFCIRREAVRIHSIETNVPPAANFIPAQLRSDSFTPTVARLTFSLQASASSDAGASATIEAEVSRQRYDELRMAEQRRWLVELPAAAIHIFQSGQGSERSG